MLTWRPPSAIFSRTCCRASGGIRLRASSWVTRARVSPSWRAMSARRRDELFDNSACQDLARTSASVSGSFHWPTGGWVVLAGSGKRNSIGDKENGRMPDFWSGIPTKNRRRTGLEKFVCSRASRSHLQPTTYTRWLFCSKSVWAISGPFFEPSGGLVFIHRAQRVGMIASSPRPSSLVRAEGLSVDQLCLGHLRAKQREALRQAEHLFQSLLRHAFSAGL